MQYGLNLKLRIFIRIFEEFDNTQRIPLTLIDSIAVFPSTVKLFVVSHTLDEGRVLKFHLLVVMKIA